MTNKPGPWAIESNVDTLVDMWQRGHSATQIAMALGQDITRNAVIGKATRLKLTQSKPPRRTGPKPVSSPPDVLKQRAAQASRFYHRKPAGRSGEVAQAREEAQASRDEGLILPTPAVIVDDVQNLISLLQLTEHTCKWPVGDPKLPGFGFCGRSSIEARPYCQMHNERSRNHI